MPSDSLSKIRFFSFWAKALRKWNYLGTNNIPVEYARRKELKIYIIHTNNIVMILALILFFLGLLNYIFFHDPIKALLISFIGFLCLVGQSFKWIGKIHFSSHMILLLTSLQFVFIEYYTYDHENKPGGYYIYLFISIFITSFLSSSMIKRNWIHTISLIGYPLLGILFCLLAFPFMFPNAGTTELKMNSSFFINVIFFVGMLFILAVSQVKAAKELKKQLLKTNQLLVNAIDTRRKDSIRMALTSQEIERKRISREIHDGVGQLLTVIKINVESMVLTDNESCKKINNLTVLITNAILELRNISYNLQPIDLASENICDLLYELCSQSTVADTVKVCFETDDSENYNYLPPDVKLHVFRITQEALNNSLKYSGANLIFVKLHFKKPLIHLEISEKGVGFDLEKTEAGNGLTNIRLRAELLQSNAVISSFQAKGTSVSVSFKMYDPTIPSQNVNTRQRKKRTIIL